MIKIFRALRQQMITENKFTRYLLYALGEIVLVVVGIFIALQLNIANENRKAKKFEATILKNIQEDILADKIDFELNLTYLKKEYRNEQLLLNFLLSEGQEPDDSISYTDALGLDLITAFHRASFNNLQNNDIGLISNNTLYKRITRFYDFYATSITLLENDHDYANTYDEKLIFFKKHFKVLGKKTQIELNSDADSDTFAQTFSRYDFAIADVASLKNDEAFKMVLAESLFINDIKIDFYTQILDKIDELKNDIDEELKRLE